MIVPAWPRFPRGTERQCEPPHAASSPTWPAQGGVAFPTGWAAQRRHILEMDVDLSFLWPSPSLWNGETETWSNDGSSPKPHVEVTEPGRLLKSWLMPFPMYWRATYGTKPWLPTFQDGCLLLLYLFLQIPNALTYKEKTPQSPEHEWEFLSLHERTLHFL